MADADIRNDIYVLALENTVKHKAVPRAGAILGSVMGAHPELRNKAKEINALIPEILEEVATLSFEEREEKLMSLNPGAIEKMHEKKERSHELPDLPNAESGVVMRFAPNPSGPLHLGHARASVLNDYYVEKYGGKFYYRVEDTDPKRVDPSAYEMVPEDLAWLGIWITDVVYQMLFLGNGLVFNRVFQCQDIYIVSNICICHVESGEVIVLAGRSIYTYESVQSIRQSIGQSFF